MEIRPIRAGEAETFLRLLCSVFELDYARAHRIFFIEPLFDLNRKWALFEDGEMRSILTTVMLEFGWGRAIGIAGVATMVEHQGKKLASHLLEEVIKTAAAGGEKGALLFARNPTLYERQGFAVLDQVVRGPIEATKEREPFGLLDFQEIQDRYNLWALQDPNRLRRDDKRWGYWRWNLRVCTAFEDGYLCTDGGVVRECVLDQSAKEWPLAQGTEWLGLASMAKHLGVPLQNTNQELHLMGRNIPALPQMFMTDQF
jgi:GNAT superfamily N-acetyltransferase